MYTHRTKRTPLKTLAPAARIARHGKSKSNSKSRSRSRSRSRSHS